MVHLDFVGVGAARCGTTWLARCLREHPSLFLPARKELHYFGSDAKYDPSLAWLRPHFVDAAPGQLRGEFTPRYLIQPVALDRLARHFPEARILILLRDPLERALSQYRYFRLNKKKEPVREFAAALDGFHREDYLVKGRYADQLEGVFERFPRERVWVGLYDDVRDRPAALLGEVFGFLGVDPAFRPSVLDRVVNESGKRTAEPGAAWARTVRWLTYSRNPLVARYRGRILERVERRNRRLDSEADRAAGEGGDEGGGEPVDETTAAAIYDRWFAEQVERTEALLGRDLSAWKRAGSARAPAARPSGESGASARSR